MWQLAAMGLAPLMGKVLGRMFGPKYPKSDYNYQLPTMDWGAHYNTMMSGPRREAKRYSQAAAARTLPGGPRTQAQTRIGQDLMRQANQLSTQLSAQKLSSEVPWAQQQQAWKREDLMRKYFMGRQDWQDICHAFMSGNHKGDNIRRHP